MSYSKVPLKYINSFDLSNEAKLLWINFLDRFSLSNSKADKWSDSFGVFIYYTRRAAMELLDCCQSKITKIFEELREHNLIKEKKQGLGKPHKIYMQFPDEIAEDLGIKVPDLQLSKVKNNEKSKGNQIDLVNINLITNRSSAKAGKIDYLEAIDFVSRQIDYEKTISRFDDEIEKKLVDQAIDVLATVYSKPKKNYKINQRLMAAGSVIEKLKRVDADCIEYVCDCIKKTTNPILNMKAYMIVSLYNAVDGAKDYIAMKTLSKKNERARIQSEADKRYTNPLHYDGEVTYSQEFYDNFLKNSMKELEKYDSFITDPVKESDKKDTNETSKAPENPQVFDETDVKAEKLEQKLKAEIPNSEKLKISFSHSVAGGICKLLKALYKTDKPEYQCNNHSFDTQKAIAKIENISINEFEEMALNYKPSFIDLEEILTNFLLDTSIE